MSKLYSVLLTFKERINAFYLLAFIPILMSIYSYITWPFGAINPIYGFILLLIKKEKLLLYDPARRILKAFGLFLIIGSFFTYYGIVLFFPKAHFYTPANYAIFIFGLCLTFFEVSALKEIFSSLILIVAGNASDVILAGLSPYASPYVTPFFAQLMASIMNLLGIETTLQPINDSQIMIFRGLRGTFSGLFTWYCVGVSYVLIFSIMLVVLLLEEHRNLKSSIIWSIIGIAGIWLLNVLRVTIMLLTYYFYGVDFAAIIHYVIGYTIFITWLTVFLYLLSKKTAETSS